MWTHTLIMLEGLQSPSPTLALGVLLHDVGKPGTFPRCRSHPLRRPCGAGRANRARNPEPAAIFKRRYRSGDRADRESHAIFACHQMRESTLKRMLRLPAFEEHLELHRLDCSSSHGHLGQLRVRENQVRRIARRRNCVRRGCVTGDDLIAAGYAPGSGLLAHAGSGRRRATGGADSQQGGGPGTGAIDVRASPEGILRAGMGAATLVSVEDYLSTSYSPDREYIDGRIVERNLGEKTHSRFRRT